MWDAEMLLVFGNCSSQGARRVGRVNFLLPILRGQHPPGIRCEGEQFLDELHRERGQRHLVRLDWFVGLPLRLLQLYRNCPDGLLKVEVRFLDAVRHDVRPAVDDLVE